MTSEAAESPPSQRVPDSDDFPTGPALGEALPDFTLVDQSGRAVNFTTERAHRRAMVVFQRSTRW